MNTEALIKENLETWSSAIKTKATTGRGSGKKRELYGIKKLRELILELAVRGLLVPQDPEDEPASELFKSIIEERDRLIKAGEIKKVRIKPTSNDKTSTRLPASWKLVTMAEIGDWGSGSTPKRDNPNFYTGNHTWLKSGELNDCQKLKGSSEKITDDAIASGSFRHNQVGDVLIAMYGATIGKIAILAEDAFTNQAVCGCTPFDGVYNRYLFYYLRSQRSAFHSVSEGGAQPNISKVKLLYYPFPLPPLAEQHRIVAKVDELMAICDQLEEQQEDSLQTHETLVKTLLTALTTASDSNRFCQAWKRIASNFDLLFTTENSIEELKQTILQLAVMGKLVPQDPEDESAAALLKKIAEEKAKFVKQGVIKKQNKPKAISKEEKTFMEPPGWAWARWNSVALKIGDIDHKMPSDKDEGIPYVSPRDFYPNNEIRFSGSKKISREDFEKLAAKIRPELGDIIFPRYGTIGANMLVDTDIDFLASYSCCVIKTMDGFIDPKYQFFFSISSLVNSQCRATEKKTTQANVGIKSIQEFLIPIPPLAEQHRIVAKVDEMMALCDQLKESLVNAQATKLKLSDSLVQHAVNVDIATYE